MTLHVTPVGVTVVGLGWILIACALATVPHRMKRALHHADPGENDYTPPPTPQPDPSWIDSVSVDCLSDCDPLLHERFDAIVTGSWFDGAIHYPVLHTHDGGVA